MWVNYRFDRSTVIIGSVIVAWVAPLIVIFSDFSSVTENSFTLKMGLAVVAYITAFFLFSVIFVGLSALVNNIQLNQQSGLVKVRKEILPYSQVTSVEVMRKYNQTRPVYSLVFHFEGTERIGKVLVSEATERVKKEALLDMVQCLSLAPGGISQESELKGSRQQVTQSLLEKLVQSLLV